MLRLDVVILLPDADGRLEVRAAYPPNDHIDGIDTAAARLAWDESRSAGRGTEALLTAQHLFLPLRTSHGPIGAVGISRTGAPLNPEEERLLAALLDQAAVAIERIRLAAEMDAARLAAETERLRSALLSSLSHDLKTPLASITGAVTALRQYADLYDAAARDELAATIQDEAERLARFVANLLDMTRLEAGGIALDRQPVDLGEAVGTALQRIRRVLAEHRVAVDLALRPPDARPRRRCCSSRCSSTCSTTPPSIRPPGFDDHDRGPPAMSGQVALTVSDEGPGIPPRTSNGCSRSSTA